MPMFINRNGKILGPLTDDAFKKSLDSGRVLPGDQVGVSRDGPWRSATELLPRKAPPAAASRTSPQPSGAGNSGPTAPSTKRDDLFAGQNFQNAGAFRDNSASAYGGFTFVEEDESAAVVVGQTGADKNLHYLDDALSEELEAERNDEIESEKNRKKFTILAIVAPIFILLLIVTPFVLYSASRPIRLRMAADSALNRMVLQLAKAKTLSDNGKTSEANFAISQATSAAVELKSALDRMTDEQRTSWQEANMEDLLKSRFR